MKKLFVAILTILMLSGCAFAPKFDNTEYDRFVGLLGHVQYTSSLCTEPEVVKEETQTLVYKTTQIDIYATYRPAHDEIKKITALILANLNEMKNAYESQSTPSTAYCIGKLKIIENSLKRLLPIMGNLQQ